ncbi:hypothetical protein BC831DRAFT_444275 [Entophlyctis helioformis]|nr:hypothetical protein BC831DRAFT_444275 [Entophlyctis helioformis]
MQTWHFSASLLLATLFFAVRLARPWLPARPLPRWAVLAARILLLAWIVALVLNMLLNMGSMLNSGGGVWAVVTSYGPDSPASSASSEPSAPPLAATTPGSASAASPKPILHSSSMPHMGERGDDDSDDSPLWARLLSTAFFIDVLNYESIVRLYLLLYPSPGGLPPPHHHGSLDGDYLWAAILHYYYAIDLLPVMLFKWLQMASVLCHLAAEMALENPFWESIVQWMRRAHLIWSLTLGNGAPWLLWVPDALVLCAAILFYVGVVTGVELSPRFSSSGRRSHGSGPVHDALIDSTASHARGHAHAHSHVLAGVDSDSEDEDSPTSTDIDFTTAAAAAAAAAAAGFHLDQQEGGIRHRQPRRASTAVATQQSGHETVQAMLQPSHRATSPILAGRRRNSRLQPTEEEHIYKLFLNLDTPFGSDNVDDYDDQLWLSDDVSDRGDVSDTSSDSIDTDASEPGGAGSGLDASPTRQSTRLAQRRHSVGGVQPHTRGFRTAHFDATEISPDEVNELLQDAYHRGSSAGQPDESLLDESYLCPDRVFTRQMRKAVLQSNSGSAPASGRPASTSSAPESPTGDHRLGLLPSASSSSKQQEAHDGSPSQTAASATETPRRSLVSGAAYAVRDVAARAERFRRILSSHAPVARTVDAILSSRRADNQRRNQMGLMCVVCAARKRDIILQPCNHLCLCEECKVRMGHESLGKCPVCSRTVESSVKIFWS